MMGNIDHCDTELCLSPCGLQNRSHSSPSDYNCSSAASSSRTDHGRATAAKAPGQQQQDQITIFYGGRMSVCDVTEIQARAIICMAKCEMEEMETMKHNNDESGGDGKMRRSFSMPSTPAAQPLHPAAGRLSMKRSLQRFLERRKTRAIDSFPYHHDHRGQRHVPPQ